MKKILSALFIFVLLFLLCVSTSAKTVLLGDVDGNGKISVADAREIVVAIANNTPLDVLVADVNKDGKVSVADARKIVVAIAKG